MPRVKDPTQYNGYIQAIVNDLGIDEVKVSWRSVLRKNVAGSAYRYTRTIRILKSMSRLETMKTLAHELRHIWQYQTGIYPSGNVWDGVTYDRNDIMRGNIPDNYYEQPWENDAEAYAEEAVKRFVKEVKEVK